MNRILVYGMTNNPGGIESYLMNEFSLLEPTKAIFDFIVDFPEMVYSDKVKAMGSQIYFIPAKGKKLFSHLFSFYKILRKHPEYKKVYFNILDAGAAFSMVVPWLMHREIIAHSHNGSTDKMRLHLLCKPFMKFLAKKKIACSRVAAKYMFDTENVDIIPNAINCSSYKFDLQKRNEKREELNLSPDNTAVCFVGRLTHQKNVEFLVRVFAKVREKNNNAVLLVIGDGEDKEKMINKANQLGISDSIRFLGKRNDVPDILNAADVYLMTSFYEGLSVVAIEAQASGVPCVFSDGMSEETKINSNVCFVSLNEDAEKWAEVVISAQSSPRIEDISALQKAGYDLTSPNDVQKRFLEYFYE